MGIYIACLCHDVDHRGYTNQHLVNRKAPLALMYPTSTMEQHHFQQTTVILQYPDHNIFEYFTADEYEEILLIIKNCILATDLALYFGNRSKLRDIYDTGKFDWNDKQSRNLTMAITMTTSDLCNMYKPWSLQLQLVFVVMEEFWNQV